MSEATNESEGDQEKHVWLITGCSSGLGRMLAEEALHHGDRVVATTRNVDRLREWAQGWGEDRLVVQYLDATGDGESAQDGIARATDAFGRIDVLVNNAGRVHVGAVEELSDHDLQDIFELHVFGPTRLVRAVLPQMRARGTGTIVQMSTMGSFYIKAGLSAYTATKAALEGLSATLAVEVEPFGIRVLIVEPGPHRTAVFQEGRTSGSPALPAYDQTVGVTRRFVADANERQPGDPRKAARAVVDLVRSGSPMPLRLPLGGEAVDNIRAALAAIERDISTWETVARSTRFDAV